MSILLSSRFSMWMAWGPELTFFCNAAYRRDTLGRKYPWALGRPAREVWAEIWDDIGPRIDRVLSTEQATWDAALLLFLERSGYPEESYHTFSYSPLRDDDGQVVGFLCVVSEDTDRVISERRMATLRDLGSDPSVLPSEAGDARRRGRQLGRNLRDLPFTLTYLFEDGGAQAGGHERHCRRASGGTGDADGRGRRMADRGAGARRVGRRRPGRGAFTGLPTGDWPDPPTRALVCRSLQQGDAPLGFMVAALNRYRRLDEGYRGFVDLVAGHVAAEIGSARSYRAAAAAGRGAGRTGPGQDHVLLQRQPRVPHPADVDPRPGRGPARSGRRVGRVGAPGIRRRSPQRIAARQAGQHAAGLLPHRGGPDAGALRVDRPRRRHRRSGQRLPVGCRARGAAAWWWTVHRWTKPCTSTATCGRRWSSTCCPTP